VCVCVCVCVCARARMCTKEEELLEIVIYRHETNTVEYKLVR